MMKSEKQTPGVFGERVIFAGLFLIGVIGFSYVVQRVEAEPQTKLTYTYGHRSQAYKQALSFDPFARKLSRFARSSRIQRINATRLPSDQRTSERSGSVDETAPAELLTSRSISSPPLRRGLRPSIRIPFRPRLRSPFITGT